MITVKVFFIGKDRFFVEFENNKDKGFHILDNYYCSGKLITKKMYKTIKNTTGDITYRSFNYSKYFESITPQQILEIDM